VALFSDNGVTIFSHRRWPLAASSLHLFPASSNASKKSKRLATTGQRLKTKTMIQHEHQQLLKIIHEKFSAANRPPNDTVIGNWLSLNGITTHTGADKSYRAIEAYSNSRLSQIKNQLIGIQRPSPLKAFSMGSILHQIILEPELAEVEDYVFLTPATAAFASGQEISVSESASEKGFGKRSY